MSRRRYPPNETVSEDSTYGGMCYALPPYDSKPLSSPASTISAARSTARALFCVSIHSLSCTESATMPAPAFTYSMPSFHGGAQRDGQIHVAVEAEVADRTRVNAA